MRSLLIILSLAALAIGWFSPVSAPAATAACADLHRVTITTTSPSGVYIAGACRALNIHDNSTDYFIEEDTHYTIETDTTSTGSYFLWEDVGSVDVNTVTWCENDDSSCTDEPDFYVSSGEYTPDEWFVFAASD